MIDISPRTHYELYHDWRKALDFCRALPDVAPPAPVTFHMYWREQHGRWWPSVRPFGRKQALPVKAFFATQVLVGAASPTVNPGADVANRLFRRWQTGRWDCIG